MNERVTRWVILVLLLALNLGLLGYSFRLQNAYTKVSQENMDQVMALFSENGVDFATELSSRNEPHSVLTLKASNLDKMTETFLSEENYTVSYLYGSSVQYKTEDLTILIDRDENTISYLDRSVGDFSGIPSGLTEQTLEEMLQPLGRRFAEQWLSDVYLTEWSLEKDGYHFVFRQVVSDKIYFFNTVTCVVGTEGVSHAVISCWSVSGREEQSSTLTVDEVLYTGLRQMVKAGQVPNTVLDVTDGYVLSYQDETPVAVPVQTLLLSRGSPVITYYSAQ